MKSIKVIILMLLFAVSLSASDHGIYLKTHEKISEDISIVNDAIIKKLAESGYAVLYNSDVTTPDYVREEKEENCGVRA